MMDGIKAETAWMDEATEALAARVEGLTLPTAKEMLEQEWLAVKRALRELEKGLQQFDGQVATAGLNREQRRKHGLNTRNRNKFVSAITLGSERLAQLDVLIRLEEAQAEEPIVLDPMPADGETVVHHMTHTAEGDEEVRS